MEVENSRKQHEPSLATSSHVAMMTTHYCKVCNRGFHCAGALGGHMRSHGVARDDYVVKRYKAQQATEGQKHSYFLRKNPPPHHHQLMYGEDQESDDGDEEEGEKYHVSREDEDLANCLMMLSSRQPFGSPLGKNDKNTLEETRSGNNNNKEVTVLETGGGNNSNNNNMFQCKACKKVFNSHQALGGHRASHKKVKGCYASKLDNDNNNNNNSENEFIDTPKGQDSDYSPPRATGATRKQSRVHQCSICHRVFSSGQALGGHKRCHWLASATSEAEATTLIQNFQEIKAYDHNNNKSPPLIFKNPSFQDHHQPLDLNFPPHQPMTQSYLQLWDNNQNRQNHRHIISAQICDDDDYKVKKRKLSELKDLKLDNGAPSASDDGWLQVGIATALI